MKRKIFVKVLAVAIGFLGILIIVGVAFPILSYEFTNSSDYVSFLSPVPENYITQESEVDYTKASNWFMGGAGSESFSKEVAKYYTVSVPSLRIKRATVAIGGENLAEYLIQYPGTALPGKSGNAVIFGHSILPQFYDPKDYLAIFSTLPTVKKGNEVEVNYDGISYLYRVEEKFEVSPSDLQILEQNMSGSYLTLVTCTPPGHPLRPKRFIVRAKLVPLNQIDAASWN